MSFIQHDCSQRRDSLPLRAVKDVLRQQAEQAAAAAAASGGLPATVPLAGSQLSGVAGSQAGPGSERDAAAAAAVAPVLTLVDALSHLVRCGAVCCPGRRLEAPTPCAVKTSIGNKQTSIGVIDIFFLWSQRARWPQGSLVETGVVRAAAEGEPRDVGL